MARVRLTRQRGKRAFFLIPAMAIPGALLWPAGSARSGPTVVSADCLGPICSPSPGPTGIASPSPTTSAPPSPTMSPTASPTHRPTPSAPPRGSTLPPVQPPGGSISSSAIGAAQGPPPPPPVKATSISLASEPARPEPGAVATLVITVSGQNGADKYGVSGKNVDLVLKQSPGSDAKLDATSVTTDASGAATVKLTLSQTRGRHVVDATSKSLATEWVTDTLAGANLTWSAARATAARSTPFRWRHPTTRRSSSLGRASFSCSDSPGPISLVCGARGAGRDRGEPASELVQRERVRQHRAG